MIQWLHDCRDDFKEFMNKKYGYDVMYLTKPQTNEGVMLNDLIYANNMRKVIEEFKKMPEEKKKDAEINIGDICTYKNHAEKFIITKIDEGKFFEGIYFNGTIISDGTISLIEKVGHCDELQQLLDKMKE
jgi:hypothetical protein